MRSRSLPSTPGQVNAGRGEGEGCPGQATRYVVPLGIGHGRVRSMAATGTPWRALRASRAREGGATWTPARPLLGLGAREDPGPEVMSLSLLDETSRRPVNDGQSPEWAGR